MADSDKKVKSEESVENEASVESRNHFSGERRRHHTEEKKVKFMC
jgi:hypothetical protein